MIPDLTPAEVERFHSKILIDGCGLLWDGPVNNHGYGRFEIYRGGRRVRILAHRLSFKLATGVDPGDGKVRHGCDNPPCVTPRCLTPGTQADNIRDAISRGRLDISGLTAFREALIAEATARIAANEKPCSRCRITKPMGEFALNSHNADGRAYWCKTCVSGGMSERERRRLKRQGPGASAESAIAAADAAWDAYLAADDEYRREQGRMNAEAYWAAKAAQAAPDPQPREAAA